MLSQKNMKKKARMQPKNIFKINAVNKGFTGSTTWTRLD